MSLFPSVFLLRRLQNTARLIWSPKNLYLLIPVITFMYLYLIFTCLKHSKYSVPVPRPAIQKPSVFTSLSCPTTISNNSITSIMGTRYVMVSAFTNDNVERQVRIITIMNTTHSEPLTCIFCCVQNGLSISPVIQDKHSDNFGFPFITTDAFCDIEPMCNATHVTISTPRHLLEVQSHLYLPIRSSLKHRTVFDVDFTLCLSCLFGKYNNILQFVQTLEMYKLLGVDRVLIYNTSCTPEFEKVLHSYVKDGMLEIIPWPIHRFFVPSKGWDYKKHPGEVHYFGQQATLNDCIHRNKQRSKYVLLNDADEIIMPYRHDSLHQLMAELQENNPHATSFIFQTHVFSTRVTTGSSAFDVPQWRQIPGANILRHIYREPIPWWVNNPSKMIVNPRKVMQTSVHTVLKSSGKSIKVSNKLAIVMHTTNPRQPHLYNEQLIMDKKIWQYSDRLIHNVNEVLWKSGVLK